MVDLYSNAYSLASSKNVYERQRSVSTDKRVVNLTRSFYAGQQRYGTIYWNGDLNADSINCVKMTVAGGINSCMAGNAYWCSDIGGFQNNCSPGIASCEEIMTRWFQAGTFFPIFRVHGTRATEIYNYSAQTQQICTEFSRVRYRLMPYIYSLAWKVTNENYTITRALPFDFPSDPAVFNIANQFMFGPALLINPVTVAGATSRSVYLPAGTWYDFWTGAPNANTAGRTVTASAPIQTIPVYARAGAIIPMGPRIQWVNQKQPDTIELRVYPGADGNFTLYEDEGDNYGYESGSFAIIPISYNNASGVVTIGSRTGTFPGMLTNRIFNIVFVNSGHGIADTITPNPDCVISYGGSAVSTCALPPSLPLPWAAQDIGSVSPAGSASWAADSFTVKGSGADIWGAADAFRFVSQSLTGDATIIARVASQSNSNGWAKSGIMFREALTAGAKHVTLVVTPSNGVNLQYRATTGGTSTTVAAGTGITAPIWLKLVHSGSTFTAYRSTDGSTWTQAATLTQTMVTSLYAGLCVCSHLAGTLCTTVFKNVSATVTVPNNAPTIATAAKATPNPVTALTTALSVLGADDNGEANLIYTWATTGTPPATVTFSANGTNAAKSSTATFTKAGSYNFQVTVKDQGNLTVTSAIAVTVNQTPTAIVVSPASATVNTSATQQFSAAERDQFGANLASQPAFTWSVSGGGTISASGLFTAGTTAGGPYTVTAKSGAISGTGSVTVSLASMPVYRLNSGGSAASPFTADQYYTGGTAASTTSAITTTGVTNPAPQAVYQTERYGTFSYTLPGLVAAAQYTVRLHFAEIYFTASGQRTFNVVINGTNVLTNYDIYAATGARYKAVVREFTATADAQGRIVINFNNVINNAKSSGIEIIRK
jgi:hypothetical protein